MFLFGLLTRVTSNGHVHFTSKSCRLREQMGSANCTLVGCYAAGCGDFLNHNGK